MGIFFLNGPEAMIVILLSTPHTRRLAGIPDGASPAQPAPCGVHSFFDKVEEVLRALLGVTIKKSRISHREFVRFPSTTTPLDTGQMRVKLLYALIFKNIYACHRKSYI
jgi:hypothetical protein